MQRLISKNLTNRTMTLQRIRKEGELEENLSRAMRMKSR